MFNSKYALRSFTRIRTKYCFIIFCLLICCYELLLRQSLTKIHLLFVFPIVGNRGPSSLAKSYRYTITNFSDNKRISKYFGLKIVNKVSLDFYRNYVKKKYNLIWFLYGHYFNELNRNSNNINFKNVIYGPTVSPIKWYRFPIKNTYEENWSYCVNKLLAYIVQSERVKMHLIKRSKKIANIENKYIVSNGCVVNNDVISILPLWETRLYDILIYAKFADLNREKELHYLISSLNNTYSLTIIRYGYHSKQFLANISSNSKIVIYYSFYDCWPSSLMEIVRQGVYPIVQQCELIGIYGKCVEHIDRNISYIKKYIYDIISHNYDANIIANYYNTKNSCINVLRKTLSSIYYKITNITIDI